MTERTQAELAERLDGLSDEKKALLLRALRERSRQGRKVARLPRLEAGAERVLSSQQERLWFLDQLMPDSPAYNLPFAVELEGPLDVEALSQALGQILERHEVLHTVFEPTAEGVRPVLRPVPRDPLPTVDLTAFEAEDMAVEARRLALAEAQEPFDLSADPMLRARLLKLGEQRHQILLTVHHIAADGWSLGILVRELGALYAAAAAGDGGAALPPLAVQYADYAAWQRQKLSEGTHGTDVEYWRQQLAGSPPELTLPTDRPRPNMPVLAGERLGVGFDPAVIEALTGFCRRRDVTLFMGLMALFQGVLGRWSGQADFNVGTPVAGRDMAELEPLIGFFVNTLVIRADLSGDPSMTELFERVKGTVIDAQAHKTVPFERLVEALQPQRHLSHTPLFQVALAFQNLPAADSRVEALSLRRLPLETATSKFDLTLELTQQGDRVTGSIEYRTELFDPSTIRRLITHLERLIVAAVESPGRPLSSLPLLDSVERDEMLAHGRRRGLGAEALPSLVSRFAESTARWGNRPAVRCGEEQWTYTVLAEEVHRLAHHLRATGIGAGDLVGLCVDRTLDLPRALLAILHVGGAYLPLDPSYPAERRRFMLADAGARTVLCDALGAEGFAGETPAESTAGGEIRLVRLDLEAEAIARCPATPVEAAVDVHSLAYVLYTSGSTGRPKGVPITHGNVSRLLRAGEEFFDFSERDVWTLFHSYAFDFSVWELWGALAHGGEVVVVPHAVSRAPEQFLEWVRTLGVTVLNQTPSAFRQFVAADGASGDAVSDLELRWVIFGGEALDLADLVPWFERHGDQKPRLVNMYGITETTVHVTFRQLTAEDALEGRGSLIGGALGDLDLHVLDRHLEPMPLGVVGELYVGGPGLSRGYFGRPGLAAERFVPHPHATDSGERLYRTGDLARRLTDGDLEYRGRNDHQVKVRGFRIELGEIETVLRGLPEVDSAVVLADEGSLVAWLVPADAEQPPTVDALRLAASGVLPNYMVPATFLLLDALPLTEHGKLDRRALPREGAERLALGGEYVAPRTERERVLADIWQRVLGVEKVGALDNFFALGGDSIRSIQVRARAEEAGLRITLQQMFEQQTLEGLAAVAEVHGPDPEDRSAAPFSLVQAVDRGRLPEGLDDAYPLAMLQTGMLFHGELSEGSTTYHDVFSYTLEAPFDPGVLRRALTVINARHGVLRTAFDMVRYEEPLQLVHSEVELDLEIFDWRSRTEDAARAALGEWIEAEKRHHFDWRRAPLVRYRVHRLSDAAFQFTLSFHHVILDGWSVATLLTELFTLYLGELEGSAVELDPAPKATYGEFVALEREALESPKSRDFWRRQLAAVEVTSLPKSSRGVDPQATGVRLVRVPLDIEVGEGLVALARTLELPVKSVLLAAHCRVLGWLLGQRRVLTGMVTHGRSEDADSEKVLGLFLNTLPFALDLDGASAHGSSTGDGRAAGDGSAAGLARAAFAMERELLEHRRFPLGELQAMAGGAPLFDVAFNYIHFHVYQGVERSAKIRVLGGEVFEETNFDLVSTFSLDPEAQQVRLDLHYDARTLGLEQVERWGDYYARALGSMVRRPGEPLGSEELLSPAERRQLLGEWNHTPLEVADPRTIHGLFAAQVMRDPQATALVDGDETLTYGELSLRARRLAAHLKGLGVGPETVEGSQTIVGVCLERSARLVVTLLGVMKAGGAYLPLDPTYPKARLAHMVSDSGLGVIVTDTASEAALPEFEGIVHLDWHAADIDAADPEVLDTFPAAGPDQRAYLMYTSGSTGQSKGVEIIHRTVANFFAGMDRAVGCGPDDVLLAVTSMSFDISVLELFWTLARGAKVVLVDEAAMAAASQETPTSTRPVDFSLLYFAAYQGTGGGDKYRLLLEGARFADQHGFKAVWTPERHFDDFGGLYPNPSVVGAGLATMTENIEIRAGSVVLPLHHPIRVAEEWSVVDNLSRGRVGVAFASGWHANDFVFFPQNFADRKAVLEQSIETVRALWRGETIRVTGGAGNEIEVRILPEPIQPDLPIWVTAAGSPDTFRQAGTLGANVLTHLLGQTFDEVEEKIQVYRQARAEAGHDPEGGCVTLMLHTLVGDSVDAVREVVREPFTEYLRSSFGLVKKLADSVGRGGDLDSMDSDDAEDMLRFAFERYFSESALFGDLQRCEATVDRARQIGVDEVACLIDFGVEVDDVLDGLRHVDTLRRRFAQGTHGARASLGGLARTHGATLLQCTPSLMRLVAQGGDGLGALGGLRALLLGGEALPPALARDVREALPSTRLVNMYGPTETTIWSMTLEVDAAAVDRAAEAAAVAIGAPIANTQIHLLDRVGDLVPIQAPGEILIGGDGLARGYFRRPGLTAERFVPDPFSESPGARLYRTGDLGRRGVDGVVEFHGRVDHQVKLRGVRIELGEIEARLTDHPAVVAAAAVVREDTPGDARLVAYWVATDADVDEPSVDGEVLRRFLAETLPSTMVPARCVLLPALPLTPNGKIDRRSLPTPEDLEEGGGETVAPRTVVEEILANLAARILRRREVSVTDSFFDLGGHSLLAIQWVSRVREAFGVELPLRRLFESPTVAQLAGVVQEMLSAKGEGAPVIEPVPRRATMPVSFGQERMWFLHLLDPESSNYNMPFGVWIEGEVDVKALGQALDRLLDRHEVLRTALAVVDGEPVQVIQPRGTRLPLPLVDLSGLGVERAEALVQTVADAEFGRPFDLTQWPLIRARLSKLASDRWYLTLTLHHTITDGWSMTILTHEIAYLYHAMAHGVEPDLPSLPVQYADYAQWQRAWFEGDRLEEALDYWRQQLADPPPLELPGKRQGDGQTRGAQRSYTFGEELAESLRELGRSEGVTLFMTLLAAFNALLYHTTRQRDFVVGTAVAGRNRVEIEGLIGMFVNLLPLRTRFEDCVTFRDLLHRVREVTTGAYAYQDAPLERLVEQARGPRTEGRSPLFQIGFSLNNVPEREVETGDLKLRVQGMNREEVRFDMTLWMSETNGLQATWTFDQKVYPVETVELLQQRFQRLLEQVIENPDRDIDDIDIVSRAEKEARAQRAEDKARAARRRFASIRPKAVKL